MRCLWLAQCLIRPVLLVALASGCQSLHSYRPAPVLVQDAETKQPIPGAEVRIWYPLTRTSLAPWRSSETTGADGIARLRAAPYGEAGVIVDAAARGYLTEEINVSEDAVEALEPAGWFEKVEQRSANLVVELYAEPGPTVELILPPGYRGYVKTEVKIGKDVPLPAGQRVFRFDVPSSGVVAVTVPALLRRVLPQAFRARYAGGALLSQQVEGPEVGFWWLRMEGRSQVYFVGTQMEYRALLRVGARQGL